MKGRCSFVKREAIIFLFLSILVVYASLFHNTHESQAAIIPDDAIRLRILAHSNADADQKVKRMIRDKVRAQISTWVEHYASKEKARAEIKKHLPEIETIVARELKHAGIDLPFTVQFGVFSFPTKLYGNIVYPAGEYETLLITIGDGLGANWWCVLFPPLCFLDIESGEAVVEKVESDNEEGQSENEPEQDEMEIEYSFFIIDWLKKLWITLKDMLKLLTNQ